MTALELFFLSLDAEARSTWTGLVPLLVESRAFTRSVASSPAPAMCSGRTVEKGGTDLWEPVSLRTPRLYVNMQPPIFAKVFTA